MSKITFDDKKVTGRDCPKFRVSYANVLKPKATKDGKDPKYSLTMLFPKKTDLSAFKRAAQNAANEKFGDRSKWPKTLKMPFRDGDTESDQPGYADHIFVRASSKERPGLVDRDLTPIVDDEDGREKFYSGCYAKATVVAFYYDVDGSKGISFALLSVQKVGDGEKFGGRRDAAEEFDVEADDSDEESAYSDDGDGEEAAMW